MKGVDNKSRNCRPRRLTATVGSARPAATVPCVLGTSFSDSFDFGACGAANEIPRSIRLSNSAALRRSALVKLGDETARRSTSAASRSPRCAASAKPVSAARRAGPTLSLSCSIAPASAAVFSAESSASQMRRTRSVRTSMSLGTWFNSRRSWSSRMTSRAEPAARIALTTSRIAILSRSGVWMRRASSV